jgi:hypothetical protein
LHRLSDQLSAELAAPTEAAVPAAAASSPRTPEHVTTVLAALAESGALEALGLQRIPPPETESEAA